MNAGTAGAGAGASTESGSAGDHRAGGAAARAGDDGGRLGRAERRGEARQFRLGLRQARVLAGGSSAAGRPRRRRPPPRSSSRRRPRSLLVGGRLLVRRLLRGRSPAPRSVGAGVLVVGHEGSPPVVLPGADRIDWRPRRSTGWAGRAAARGTAEWLVLRKSGTGSRAAVAAAGGRTAGGARTRGARVRCPCWSSVVRWSECPGRWSGAGASRLAAVPLDVARPRGSTGQIAACSPWQGCAPRGQDRADRPRSRCRRAGPAPHARPGGATAGAGRRRQPERPTRRQVVQRASAAGRPCAVWHNLPPRPPTRWSPPRARRCPAGRSWCAWRR